MALSGMLGTFELFDSKKEELINHGYVENGDDTSYNRAAVLEIFEELCEGKEVEEKRILWWEKENGEETVFLAYPVMMSLLMEEYGYTKRFLELGYEAGAPGAKTCVFASNVSRSDMEYEEIFPQSVLLWKKIPVDILKKIFEPFERLGNFFDFQRDYWGNPLLSTHKGFVARTSVPDMSGLKHVFRYFPHMLYGFISKGSLSFWGYRPDALNTRTRRSFIDLLLKISKDDADALKEIIAVHRPDTYDHKYKDEEKEIDYWLSNLQKFEAACSGQKDTGRIYFEMLFDFMTELKRMCGSKTKRIERFEVLKEAIQKGRPKDYTAEDFLAFVYDRKERPMRFVGDWSEYIGVWKTIVKEPLVLRRNNGVLWDFLYELFHINEDEDDYDEEEEVTAETKLLSYLVLLENIQIVDSKEDTLLSQKDLFIELAGGLMEIESEEILLACIRNQMIPRDQIALYADIALRFNKLHLAPILIMEKNKG